MSEPQIIKLDEKAAESVIRCASAVQKITLIFANGTKLSTVMGPGQEILLEHGSGPRPDLSLADAGTTLGSLNLIETDA